ncbi:MAG: group II intron reverse transcriptase/maturase [Psychrobacillus sp.]
MGISEDHWPTAEKWIEILRDRKRTTNMNNKILDLILSRDNLNEAFKQVKKNKGSAGVDNMSIDETFIFIKEHKKEIVRAIKGRKYTPKPVLRVEIPKPNGGTRLLGIPTVIDRVIQQAIVQVLTPIFDPTFHENSFGFRPGKNAQGAILKFLEYCNEGYNWVVDIDLESFFDRVNHDRLMNLVSRKVHDGDIISLIRKYLVSGVMVDGKFYETRVGTPQGGNLSPLLSNIMLNELDTELENRGLRFVRYADDCVIMVKSDFAARRVMRSITRFIESKLGLKVNTTKSKVTKPDDPDMKFLGFGFYYHEKEQIYKALPHTKSVEQFKYNLHKLSRRNWGVSMSYRLSKLNQVIRGWVNYFKIGSMKKVLSRITSHLRFRLRMCIWKQWKTGKNRVKSLIKLGMSPYWAHINGNSSKGVARIASSWVMHTTVTNKILAQKGLVSPYEYYLNQVHVT